MSADGQPAQAPPFQAVVGPGGQRVGHPRQPQVVKQQQADLAAEVDGEGLQPRKALAHRPRGRQYQQPQEDGLEAQRCSKQESRAGRGGEAGQGGGVRQLAGWGRPAGVLRAA